MKHATVLSIFQKFQGGDIHSLTKDLHTYIDVLIDVTNSLPKSKTQMPIYKIKIESLLVKYAISAKTFLHIIKGTKMESTHFSDDFSILDLPSMHITARSLFENYLIIYYLFIQEKDNEEVIEYRNLMYEVSGLCKRQDVPTRTEHLRKKREQEVNTIAILKARVQQNSEFQKLTNSQKNKFLNAPNHRVPAKIFTWTKLFELSSLYDDVFQESWGLYSNYAHSEFLSLMQVEGVFGDPSIGDLFIFQAVKCQVLLMAHLITEFSQLFDCTVERFASQEEKIKEEIHILHTIATGNINP